MPKNKSPVTNAIRVLRENRADFILCPYKYEDKGGTAVSARELGVDEHLVIKTLVMEDEEQKPLIILMHGDKRKWISSWPGPGISKSSSSTEDKKRRNRPEDSRRILLTAGSCDSVSTINANALSFSLWIVFSCFSMSGSLDEAG
jgi:hypothetical protein